MPIAAVGEADVGAQHEVVAVVALLAHVHADHVGVRDRRGVAAHALQHLGHRALFRRGLDQAQDAVDAQVVALVHVHADRLAVVVVIGTGGSDCLAL